MTTNTPPAPAPFTKDDYAARMARVTQDAVQAGLAGLTVAPGPDLVWHRSSRGSTSAGGSGSGSGTSSP